ncbi:unnamed protein product [Rhodiola kirilowii]
METKPLMATAPEFLARDHNAHNATLVLNISNGHISPTHLTLHFLQRSHKPTPPIPIDLSPSPPHPPLFFIPSHNLNLAGPDYHPMKTDIKIV